MLVYIYIYIYTCAREKEERERERHTQTNRQTDGQAGRQAGRQADNRFLLIWLRKTRQRFRKRDKISTQRPCMRSAAKEQQRQWEEETKEREEKNVQLQAADVT